ncbi:MAG: ubiquitin-like domain-containing protein [Bacillota bacterium]
MDWYVISKKQGHQDPGTYGEATAHKTRLRLAIIFFFAILAGLGVTGWAWAKKEVRLEVDGKELVVTTFQMDVKGLLKQVHVRLGPEDAVVPVPETSLREGMRVKVIRAIPVTIVADGESRPVLTKSKTVFDLLKEENVKVGEEDIVNPPLESELSKGLTVTITRVSRKVEEKEVSIPFSVKRKPAASLPKGQARVISTGKNGLAVEKWEVVLHDGKEKERRLIERRVVRQPVDRVVQVGILQTVSRGGEELRFTQVYTMKATAYTYTGRNTASGIPPRLGVAAVDPSVISFGTRLYVEGYGHAVACDKGSDIKGGEIDVFFPTRAEALAWGVRYVKVYVLK